MHPVGGCLEAMSDVRGGATARAAGGGAAGGAAALGGRAGPGDAYPGTYPCLILSDAI